MRTIPDPIDVDLAAHRPRVEVVMPSLLLVAFGLVVWLSVFVGNDDGPVRSFNAVALEARAPDQISGLEAAAIAIDLAQNAVENRSAGDDGLLAGDIESVRVRYEPLGAASSWTVDIAAPIRIRPNTEEETRTEFGEIVIELSAFTGEVSGRFSAGRSFSGPDRGSGGVLNALGISGAGFTEVPLHLVWPVSPE